MVKLKSSKYRTYIRPKKGFQGQLIKMKNKYDLSVRRLPFGIFHGIGSSKTKTEGKRKIKRYVKNLH